MIPYRRPWIGFLHHTFDTSFSPYNSEALFASPDFIESLPACKAILVLSEYLAAQVRQRAPHVKVFVLTHPTEDCAAKFAPSAIPHANLLHVGGWLRNIVYFFRLKSPVQKICVKGAAMNNYVPPADFMDQMRDFLGAAGGAAAAAAEPETLISSGGGGGHHIHHNWLQHLYEYFESLFGSVKVIDTICNHDYDTLLAQNIVFLHLVDASAVNTILECIVRNTPVIVNRHPAIVEVLGQKYPLFYENDADPSTVLDTLWPKIHDAYNYLSHMDKSRFTAAHFVKQLTDIMRAV